jgi:hypothetical protein
MYTSPQTLSELIPRRTLAEVSKQGPDAVYVKPRAGCWPMHQLRAQFEAQLCLAPERLHALLFFLRS